MVTGPADDIQKINHITFWSELSDQISTLREGALRSLAQSLDIPPEVLLGLGGTNHWAAWAISDEAVQTQIKPILSRIAAALTTGYLHPALEALGIENPKHYVYHFDTAPLTTRPNRIADALNLHERALLSDEATREAGAWGEESAPSPEEHIRRLLEKLLLANAEAVLADPVLRELIGLPASSVPMPELVEEEQAPPGQPEPVEDEQAPPEQPLESEGRPARPELPPGLSVAARLATRRALGLAGARLVPHSQRPANVPRHQLHVHHGPVRDHRIMTMLAGWSDCDDVIVDLGVNLIEFRSIIDEYCADLLRRGIAHDDRLLADLFEAPSTRRRLIGGRCG